MEEYCVLVLGKVPRLSVVKQSSSIQRSKNRADLVFNVAPRTCRRATKTMVGQLGTHCARVFRIFFQQRSILTTSAARYTWRIASRCCAKRSH